MLRLRPAQPEDVETILSLWAESAAEPTHTDDVASVTRLIHHDPAALIVAEIDDRIVGTVIAAWDGWRGSIYRLVVAPPQRRRGLGLRLLAEAERRLRDVGAVRSQAIVVETDPQATGFWRASGWQQQIARLRFVRSSPGRIGGELLEDDGHVGSA